jgi:hypothetical protein
MLLPRRLLVLLALATALSPQPLLAQIRTFTDPTAFAAELKGRSGFLHDFSELFYGYTTPTYTMSGGGFSATYAPLATTTPLPDDLYGLSASVGFIDGLSTSLTSDDLTINLSGGIEAVGGTFFLSDSLGNPVTLSNGESLLALAENGSDPAASFSAPNTSLAFLGWISTTPLTRITLSGGGINPDRWASVGEMVYAGPVTVPGPLPLGAALVAGAWARRLRRRINRHSR